MKVLGYLCYLFFGGLIGTATSTKDGLLPKGYLLNHSSTNSNVKIINSESYVLSLEIYNTGNRTIVDIIKQVDKVKIYVRGEIALFTAKLKEGNLFLIPLSKTTVFIMNGLSLSPTKCIISEDSSTDLSDALEVKQTIIS